MKRYFAFTSTKSWASLLALLQRRLSNFICWARLSELIVGRSCSDELRSSQVNFPRTRRIKLSAFCLIMYIFTGRYCSITANSLQNQNKMIHIIQQYGCLIFLLYVLRNNLAYSKCIQNVGKPYNMCMRNINLNGWKIPLS